MLSSLASSEDLTPKGNSSSLDECIGYSYVPKVFASIQSVRVIRNLETTAPKNTCSIVKGEGFHITGRQIRVYYYILKYLYFLPY